MACSAGLPIPRRNHWSLSFSVYEAYDDDVYAADTGSSTALSGPETRGFYEGAQAGLDFNRPSDRVSLQSVSGDVTFINHYRTQDDYSANYRAAANMGVRVTERSRLNVNGSFVFAPEYGLASS